MKASPLSSPNRRGSTNPRGKRRVTAAVLFCVAMQTRSSPIPQRIVHYESEANRLRRIAEAEPMTETRDELLAVARQ